MFNAFAWCCRFILRSASGWERILASEWGQANEDGVYSVAPFACHRSLTTGLLNCEYHYEPCPRTKSLKPLSRILA